MKRKLTIALTAIAACLLGGAGSASAAAITADFTTGTPAANQQAWGSSLTSGLGTNTGNSSRYLASSAFTVTAGDQINASGTWYQNTNNDNPTGVSLYLGIFSSLASNATPLAYVDMGCAALNATSCTASITPTYTALTSGYYYLVYFSNATKAGDGYNTSAPGTTTIDGNQVSDVPVPATAALLGLGLIGLGAARRKQA